MEPFSVTDLRRAFNLEPKKSVSRPPIKGRAALNVATSGVKHLTDDTTTLLPSPTRVIHQHQTQPLTMTNAAGFFSNENWRQEKDNLMSSSLLLLQGIKKDVIDRPLVREARDKLHMLQRSTQNSVNSVQINLQIGGEPKEPTIQSTPGIPKESEMRYIEQFLKTELSIESTPSPRTKQQPPAAAQ